MGCPCGLTLAKVAKSIKTKGVRYQFLRVVHDVNRWNKEENKRLYTKVNEAVDKMCREFARAIEGYTQTEIKEVQDLSTEVTKTVTMTMDMKPLAKLK